MLLVMAVVGVGVAIVAMFVHALRADRSIESHRWLVVVPLLIIAGWFVAELVIKG